MSKLNLKTWMITVLLSLFSSAFAQTVQFYGFSQSQGVYEELHAPVNIITATDINLENTRYQVNLPFDFPFNNQDHTSLYVHSSGFVSFGATAPYGSTPISNSVTTFDGAISALGAYLTGRYNSTENIAATISYETTGTAPNREFVIQWKNFGYFEYAQSLVNTYDLNFQIRLKENGEINFVYDLSSTGNPSSFNAQIGLRGATSSDFHNRYAQGTATYNLASTTRGGSNTSVTYIYNNQLPASGLTFTWIPPAECIAPTDQPTNLVATKDGIITTVSYTAAQADRYLVLRTPEGVAHNAPQNGTNYTKGNGAVNTELNAHVSHITEATSFIENATNSGIQGNTAYTYTVYAVNSSCLNGPLYNLIDPLTADVVTCPAPINTINVTSADASSFGISWVPNNGSALERSYVIEVATDNQFTSPVQGSPFTTSDTSYTIDQLTPSTTYYYRIKAVTSCGESILSSVKTIATACIPVTELNEDFNGSTSLPACWSSVIRNVSSSTVSITGTGGVGGTNGVNLYGNTNMDNATADLILVTPNLSNISSGLYRVKFDAKKGSAADIKLVVGTLDNNTASAVFTPKGGALELTTEFQTYYVYFTDYQGTDAYIGFKRKGTSTYTNLFIDNVVWEPAPACAEVSGLTATNLTISTATLSWSGAGASYDIEFGLSGFTPQGVPSENLSGVANHQLISGLADATSYQYYVRQNCTSTGDGFGPWAGPFTFTTATKGHIGSQGTITSTSFPIESNYNFNYSQQIYLASELQAVLEPGETLITKIRFKQALLATYPERYNNWTVYLGNTDLDGFATATSWIPVNELTQSFQGELTFAANTWFDIELDTPFQWDGTSNLVVAVHEEVAGYSNSSFAAYAAEGANRGILYREDTNSPDPSNPPGAYTRNSNIAQIQIVAEAAEVVVDAVEITVENNAVPEITTIGGTLQLEAAITPSTSSQEVTWTVESGNAFVSVDSNGLVTGLTNGTATVRATSVEDITKYDEIIITVNTDSDDYCAVSVEYNVEPITLVDFSDLNNPSSAVVDGTPAYEDFTSMTAHVEQSETYTITVKGNTNGNFEHDIRVFIDWNQDLEFNMATEFYTVSLLPSTGEDAVEATINITVPADALPGNTRLRIIKDMWNVYEEGEFDACTDPYYGQVEDYTVNVSGAIEVTSVNITTENNVTPEITVENGTLQLEATINPLTVSQDVTWTIESGSTVVSIDQNGLVTALANGTAIVRATSVTDNTRYDEIEITVNIDFVGLETLENSISVYPNPVAEFVTVSLNREFASVTIQLVDISGKQVLEAAYSNTDSIQIDCSAFIPGVYQLIIRTEAYSVIKKIHKQ